MYVNKPVHIVKLVENRNIYY